MAKVSILVKSEGMISKGLGLATTPIWNVGKKLKEADQVIVQIDDECYTLEASDKPHVFDVQPGNHSIAAADINGGKKLGIGAAMKAAMYAGINLTGGGSVMDGISKGLDSAKESHDRAAAKHSFDEFVISEGETVEYTCQATSKGIVKLKRMK